MAIGPLYAGEYSEIFALPPTGGRYRSHPMPSTTRVIIESALTLIIGLALLGALWVAAIVLVGE